MTHKQLFKQDYYYTTTKPNRWFIEICAKNTVITPSSATICVMCEQIKQKQEKKKSKCEIIFYICMYYDLLEVVQYEMQSTVLKYDLPLNLFDAYAIKFKLNCLILFHVEMLKPNSMTKFEPFIIMKLQISIPNYV